jgi:hypothetical protein
MSHEQYDDVTHVRVTFNFDFAIYFIKMYNSVS